MGRIFESAATVLVWLGEFPVKTDLSPQRLSMLPEINIDLKDPRTKNRLEYLFQDLSEPEPMAEKLGPYWNPWNPLPAIRVVRTLFNAWKASNGDYFKRTWVVQELILARQLRFFIGARELSQHDIQQIVSWLVALVSLPGVTFLSMCIENEFEGLLHVL